MKDFNMNPELYRKFRADLLAWSAYYKGIAKSDCRTTGKVATRALRQQMCHLRQAYYIGDITY